jgi:hypothetical protein
VAQLIVVEDLAAPSVVGRGGHALWVIEILRGLARLGHKVLFVEFLDQAPQEDQLRWFNSVIGSFWQPENSALLVGPEWHSVAGVEAEEVTAAGRGADAVITLSAHYRKEPWPLIDRVRPRILWEQDPGYTHLWAVGGDPAEVFGQHDVYFTVGASIGTSDCRLPLHGIDWIPAYNPVVLDMWDASTPPGPLFGTVAGWRDYGWLEFEGSLYGPKSEEFRKFLPLPSLIGQPLQIVTDLDPDDPERLDLEDQGWIVLPSSRVDGPAQFQRYVMDSAGEFSCAKGGYVGTHSGWFSQRSTDYLAAGRPVISQATGFEEFLPTGEGLFAIKDLEEAVAAITAVRREPERHALAARALAEKYFDSDKVLSWVLDRAGVVCP